MIRKFIGKDELKRLIDTRGWYVTILTDTGGKELMLLVSPERDERWEIRKTGIPDEKMYVEILERSLKIPLKNITTITDYRKGKRIEVI